MKPKFPFWLFVLICIAVLVAVSPFAFTKKYKTTNAHVCDQCGIRQWTRSEGQPSMTPSSKQQITLEETELSRWFATNISTNCQHTWHINSSSVQAYLYFGTLRLWQISCGSGYWSTPPIIYLSSDEQLELENRLKENPEACKKYIHDRLTESDN